MPRLLPYCDPDNKPMDPVEWIIRYKNDPADFLHEKMKDREWRLSHLYYIVDADGFKVLFKPNAAQRKLIKDMWFLNVVLKARQLGFCLDPKTRILTADLEWVQIQYATQGMAIICVDEKGPGGRGNARKMRIGYVEGVREVFEPAYRITLDDGSQLTCTGNHRWLTKKKNTEAEWRSIENKGSKKKITVGTKIRYITTPWSNERKYPDGWFGGMLDGEGSFRRKPKGGMEVCVAQVNGPVMDRAREYLLSRAYCFHEEIDNRKSVDTSKLGNKAVHKLVLHKTNEIFRLVGKTRATKLLLDYNWWAGSDLPGKRSGEAWRTVVDIERLPPQRMIDLQTSEGTFIAEGFVSHNSTFIDVFILDACLWNQDLHTGIIAHTKPDAEAIFDNKVKYPYDNLHEELKNLVTSSTDRAGELKFSNGSSIRVSTSFRSGTLQILHISEYGKISANYPDKAREIKTGAIEAVKAGQMIFVESTAEGRDGEFFMLTQRARKLEDTGQPLDQLHWKFHFFAWWEKPDNIADPEKVVITSEYIKYFKDLAARGIKLSAKQKAWYIIKAEALGDDMKREHPSYPDEAFEASIEGAYYGRNIARMRQEGRIGKVPYLSDYPVYTFWDIGVGDVTAIWFFQKVLGQGRLFDYYQKDGEGLDHFASVLAKRRYVYSTFFFPHDIRNRVLSVIGGATGAKTVAQVASSLGMLPQTVVPRPKTSEEFSNQIEATRHFLAQCWIDEERCDFGIKALENYQKEWDPKGGTFRDHPKKTWARDGADALRTGAVGFRDAVEYETEELEPEEYYD